MPRFVDFSLLVALESPSEQIREYNEQIEKLAQDSYPQIEPLKQITQNAAVF